MSLPVPRRPTGLGWMFLGKLDLDGTTAFGWAHPSTATQVLSSLNMAELPKSGRIGLQWQVSVVDRTEREPKRPSEAQVRLARCAFGMLDAEEDNHHPGASRQFWVPVNPDERVDCECKTNETLVREDDGYEWTNPTDGPCRGCELERKMRAVGVSRRCPLHPTPSNQEVSP